MTDSQFFFEVADRDVGLIGYVAIDRTINDKACGGIRWGPDVTPDEVRALAHNMSLKYGFGNIRLGGAKAGIVAPFEMPAQERRQLLLAFGRKIGSLLRSRIFIPGADLGTSHEDMLTVLQGAGRGISNHRRGELAGYYTGFGVAQAVFVAAEYLGIPIRGCRVAIEGFGKVGGTIAHLLARAGAHVVAISTKYGGVYHPSGLNVEDLLALRESGDPHWIESYGDKARRVTAEDLYALPVDVLIPCAGSWMIHEGNVDRIQAKAVVPGANIPAKRNVQERLEARGILYLPDFVCNLGGVLANTLEWRGFDRGHIETFFRTELALKIKNLLVHSHEISKSPAAEAEGIALENLERMEKISQQSGRLSQKAKIVRGLRHPLRAAIYTASVYYRRGYPLREFFAGGALAEVRRFFHDDANPCE